jgi:acetyltransferase-like isoleucine patch superfamily enzyme
VLGEASVVRSHSVIYAGSSFGRGLQTGHRVLIREGTVMGEHCGVGSGAELYGELEVGDHTRIQSHVAVGKNSKVGSFVWIYLNSILANDRYPPVGELEGPIVEDYAVIGASVIVHAGIRVGARSLVGAGSVVLNDVPPERLVMGNPARDKGPLAEIRGPDGERPYPWMERVRDYGYPWQKATPPGD